MGVPQGVPYWVYLRVYTGVPYWVYHGVYRRVYTTGCTQGVYHRVSLRREGETSARRGLPPPYKEGRKPLREEASRLLRTERNLCAKRLPASLRMKEKPLREETSRLP